MLQKKAELERELESINKSILDDDESAKREAEQLGKVLRKLASYDTGKDILLHLPSSINFNMHKGHALKARGEKASYNGMKKCISLGFVPGETVLKDKEVLPGTGIIAKFEIDNVEYLEYVCVVGHEGEHSVQDALGLHLDNKSPYTFLNFTVEKLCELDTRVRIDDILESEMMKEFPEEKTPGGLFYEAEVERLKKDGFSTEQAKRTAKTNLTRLYWSNCHDIPENCSPISKQLRNYINYWNENYDMQTLRNLRINDLKNKKDVKFSILPFVTDDMLKSSKDQKLQFQVDVETGDAFKASGRNMETLELSDDGERTQEAFSIIEAYTKLMGVDLPVLYFVNTQMEKSEMSNSFIQNKDDSGRVESQIMMGPLASMLVYSVHRKEEESDKRSYYEILIKDSYDQIVNKLRKYDDGSTQFVPYRGGLANGLAYTIDAKGKCTRIREYEDGREIHCANIKFYKNGDLDGIKIKNDEGLKLVEYNKQSYKTRMFFMDEGQKAISIRFNNDGSICRILKGKKDEVNNRYDAIGNSYEYDSAGRPSKYRSGNNVEWQNILQSQENI